MEPTDQRKIAIIGDGIVAAFAARAVSDSGMRPVIHSLEGRFTVPPRGAFYLHELPESLAADYPQVRTLTTRQGNDPHAYSIKLWGKPQPTSVDAFQDGAVVEGTAYQFEPSIMERLLEHADVLVSGRLDADAIKQLATSYEGVIVTVPVSFLPKGAQPKTRQFIVVRALRRNRLCDAITMMPDDFRAQYGPGVCGAYADAQSMRELAEQLTAQWGPSLLTIYSGSAQHMWLRATQHLLQVDGHPVVDLELPYGLYSMPEWKRWQQTVEWPDGKLYQLFQQLRASLKHVKQSMRVQTKISPDETARNVSPAANVLLTGRWATWERSELSHETYARVRSWLLDLEA